MRYFNHLRRMAAGMFAVVGATIVCGVAGAGCATAPATAAERTTMVDQSRAVLAIMVERDPSLPNFLGKSAGYAMFPDVFKGGVIAGGAFGRGSVYDPRGNLLGYAKVTQGSVGGVIGARTFALPLVFQNDRQLDDFKAGRGLRFGAEATAIAIDDGASSHSSYSDGVAVFAMPKRGLMADASLNGQAFAFEQNREATTPAQTQSAQSPATQPSDEARTAEPPASTQPSQDPQNAERSDTQLY